jgi:hypothetical protein
MRFLGCPALLVAALAVLLAGLSCGQGKAEECSSTRERYIELLRERVQEASEIVPINPGDDGNARLLTRFQNIILPKVSSGFAATCEALDQAALSRCIDQEAHYFERLQLEKRELRLDVHEPWFISSPDPTCGPLLLTLERGLYQDGRIGPR